MPKPRNTTLDYRLVGEDTALTDQAIDSDHSAWSSRPDDPFAFAVDTDSLHAEDQDVPVAEEGESADDALLALLAEGAVPSSGGKIENSDINLWADEPTEKSQPLDWGVLATEGGYFDNDDTLPIARVTAAETKAEEVEARLAAAAKRTEDAEAETAAERACAEARKEIEHELASLEKEVEAAKAASREAEDACQRAVNDAEAARALEEHVAASKEAFEQQVEDCLAEARAAWERDAEARIAEKLREAEEKIEERVAAAERTAREVEAQSAELRQRLEAAEAAWAPASEERAAGSEAQPEPDFEVRLAEALREAEKKVAMRLAEAQKTWEAEIAERIAAAEKIWLRQRRGDQEVLDPAVAAEGGKRGLGGRRALLAVALIVGLSALAALHPSTKPLVAEIGGFIDPIVEVVTGAVESDPQEAPEAAERRAVIEVDRANVRAGPSTDTDVVTTLRRGQPVSLIESRGNWRRIRFGEGAADTGWVYGDLLDNPPADEAPQTPTAE